MTADILCQSETIGDIPVLQVAAAEQFYQALPTVFIQHDLLGSKDWELRYGYPLAQAGFRAVLIDAPGHGERRLPAVSFDQMMLHAFWEMVQQTVTDLDTVRFELLQRGLLQADRLGILGISLGGMIGFGALAQLPWVRTLVSLMGTPDWIGFIEWTRQQWALQGEDFPLSEAQVQEQIQSLHATNPIDQFAQFAGKPILMWHGLADGVVPIEGNRNLWRKLQPAYTEQPDALQLVEMPGQGHSTTSACLDLSLSWFGRYLLG
ncbi:alpha/beta fold hydrolase [Leptolyngbya sp. FACHB-261]|uniref:alpha/beta fold hydrolase n=1 Tax=Leptolyngbya sp. FACHB-261 TaxID=2692806 RepID=UPI00168761AE|nr:alpha/beta fold hydrolase [Leptolyngbya sp. FACHB-261]MBD2102764.1 alpha/beta fold hydrolase [Leptolyngbya sp. FACHB-261]